MKNFKCEFLDIIGLVFEDNDFKNYTQDEIKEMVKREVVMKIKTIGVSEWVDSFFIENSIKEVE